MWGKLTERNDWRITRTFTEPKELYRFLYNPDVEVMNLVFASDYLVWISWKYGAEEDAIRLLHSNEVIGIYVTAGARIHLYRYLDRLRRRCIMTRTL